MEVEVITLSDEEEAMNIDGVDEALEDAATVHLSEGEDDEEEEADEDNSSVVAGPPTEPFQERMTDFTVKEEAKGNVARISSAMVSHVNLLMII